MTLLVFFVFTQSRIYLGVCQHETFTLQYQENDNHRNNVNSAPETVLGFPFAIVFSFTSHKVHKARTLENVLSHLTLVTNFNLRLMSHIKACIMTQHCLQKHPCFCKLDLVGAQVFQIGYLSATKGLDHISY